MKTVIATGATLLLSIIAVTTPSQAAVAPATAEPIQSIVTFDEEGAVTAYVG